MLVLNPSRRLLFTGDLADNSIQPDQIIGIRRILIAFSRYLACPSPPDARGMPKLTKI
jgi:hypothetical protein